MDTEDAAWLFPGDAAEIRRSLTSQFAEEFGHGPSGVWFAPGRANLNGEHVDFHGGRCLPMALAHGTYVAAAPRTDGMLYLRTLEPTLDAGVQQVCISEVTSGPDADVHTITDDQPCGWTKYVGGTLWALRALGEEIDELAVDESFGADLLITSTLPIGGGLSSSAALECSAMLAFVAMATPLGRANPGAALDAALTDELRARLAAACVRAEVEMVGAGTGGLDQTVSLRGRAAHLLSLDCRDFTVDRIPASGLLADHRFVAVDTGQAHWLGDGQFDDRRADSEAAMRLLEAERLRDLLPDRPGTADVSAVLRRFDERAGAGETLPSPVDGAPARDRAACRRRLRHALTEMVRSEELHGFLSDDELDAESTAMLVGNLMTAGHASMRDEAEVSFPAANTVVETAVEKGAPGARLIGGGFGGSALLLCRADDVATITGAVASACAEAGHRTPRFLEITPSDPAHVIA